MTLTEKFKRFAETYNHAFGQDKLQEFINTLITDDDVHSTLLSDFIDTGRGQRMYLLYSCGEAVVLSVDGNGIKDELADEEEFNDEPPMWFSECSHRMSPFYAAKCVTDAFLESCEKSCLETPISALTVVITNSFVINLEDYVDVYAELEGIVFHQVNSFFVPTNNDLGYGEALTECFKGDIEDGSVVVPKLYSGNKSNKPVQKTEINKNGNKYDVMPLPRHLSLDGVPVSVYPCLLNPEEQLNAMVGLKGLKREINDAVAYGRFVQKVNELKPGNNSLKMSLHTILCGNPGTGKTTVCKYYASMLHKGGLLSEGHTIVANRSTFLGQNFGCEEQRMLKCLESARGGLLFVDECADLFSHPHPHDPGKAVLNLLLQTLADEDCRDIAVVLALYNEKDLSRLYALNPGLKSRFTNVIMLPDYSMDELMEIVRRRVKTLGLKFTRKAWHLFYMHLDKAYITRNKTDFGNARAALNYLQKVLVRHAIRCQEKHLEGESLLKVTVKDIPPYGDNITSVQNRSAGFNAY